MGLPVTKQRIFELEIGEGHKLYPLFYDKDLGHQELVTIDHPHLRGTWTVTMARYSMSPCEGYRYALVFLN